MSKQVEKQVPVNEETVFGVATTEIVKEDAAEVDVLEMLKNPESNLFCSVVNDGDRKTQAKIYNAVNATDEELSEHIKETLELVDVVAYPVKIVDEETGEIVECLRTVLITKDGKSYSATSQGIANSLQKMFAIVGTPLDGAWHKEPVKVEVQQVKTRNGVNKVMILKML